MESPGARLILLGASNLTRDLPAVLEIARRRLEPAPLQVLAAAGHGRCYGTASRVLLRQLPSILECGLWSALGKTSHRPTHALLTDIGNDLMQECPAARIAGWIEACAERLEPLGARVVISTLPEKTLSRLRPWQFLLFRTLLYPGRRLGLAELRRRAAELNRRLRELCARRNLRCIEPEPDWFGADAIHLRRRARKRAWETLLGDWEIPVTRGGGRSREPVPRRQLVPQCRSILGRELRRAQPCAVLGDGTTVSLF